MLAKPWQPSVSFLLCPICNGGGGRKCILPDGCSGLPAMVKIYGYFNLTFIFIKALYVHNFKS